VLEKTKEQLIGCVPPINNRLLFWWWITSDVFVTFRFSLFLKFSAKKPKKETKKQKKKKHIYLAFVIRTKKYIILKIMP